MKQQQTKVLFIELINAFNTFIKHIWNKRKPSSSFLVSSFWYLTFLLLNGFVISGLAFIIFKSNPDMEKLILSIGHNVTEDPAPSSLWDIVSAIGSLLAGLGTVGLLAFGWVKGDEWIKKINLSNNLTIVTDTLKKLRVSEFEMQEQYPKYLSFLEKYFNQNEEYSLVNFISERETMRIKIYIIQVHLEFLIYSPLFIKEQDDVIQLRDALNQFQDNLDRASDENFKPTPGWLEELSNDKSKASETLHDLFPDLVKRIQKGGF